MLPNHKEINAFLDYGLIDENLTVRENGERILILEANQYFYARSVLIINREKKTLAYLKDKHKGIKSAINRFCERNGYKPVEYKHKLMACYGTRLNFLYEGFEFLPIEQKQNLFNNIELYYMPANFHEQMGNSTTEFFGARYTAEDLGFIGDAEEEVF